jgi:hypothetical protein
MPVKRRDIPKTVVQADQQEKKQASRGEYQAQSEYSFLDTQEQSPEEDSQ